MGLSAPPVCGMGDSIVVLGPGQQGLAGVLAASVTGANPIVVVGLRKDAKRLEIAKLYGATHTVCFEDGPLDEQIKKILGPEMAGTWWWTPAAAWLPSR